MECEGDIKSPVL